MRYGINFHDTWTGADPLIKLVEQDFVNENWLQLFFDICIKCQSCVKKDVIDKAIGIVKDNEKYKSIIVSNYEKIKEFPEN